MPCSCILRCIRETLSKCVREHLELKNRRDNCFNATGSNWATLISRSIAELVSPDDTDDEFAEMPAMIEIGDTDNP